jgi:hypothetical protein
VYLNWALGLRAAGCDITWLEVVAPDIDAPALRSFSVCLKQRLERYGFGSALVLCGEDGRSFDRVNTAGCPGLEAATTSDLLLNFRYDLTTAITGRFRRSALLDIDPGLLQLWMGEGQMDVARHDLYFTTGETIGTPADLCPDVGLPWQYTPPCVSLDFWPSALPGKDAAFTTISHWSGDEWVEARGESYINDKRAGFLPFLDLPQRVSVPLELALCLAPDEDEDREMLRSRGWRVQEAYAVAAAPWDYQIYIQRSLGEFSAVKPSCVRLQNAWVSDRSLCYLASGKPVVVQHTGPSRLLPEGEGLFRFRTLEEAASCLNEIISDYARHSRQARALAAEYFDAPKVARRLLERALP